MHGRTLCPRHCANSLITTCWRTRASTCGATGGATTLSSMQRLHRPPSRRPAVGPDRYPKPRVRAWDPPAWGSLGLGIPQLGGSAATPEPNRRGVICLVFHFLYNFFAIDKIVLVLPVPGGPYNNKWGILFASINFNNTFFIL